MANRFFPATTCSHDIRCRHDEGRRPGDGGAFLIGIPFRLHGRNPEIGLDCLGVVAAALERTGRPAAPLLPNGYTLRSTIDPDFDSLARSLGVAASTTVTAAGDILAARPSPCQLHFGIAVSATQWVHAHSGLRKVVLCPVPPEWPCAGRWRFSPEPRS
ncbi:hypothetical protein ACFSHP_04660 [Novosphingobium panipatense]